VLVIRALDPHISSILVNHRDRSERRVTLSSSTHFIHEARKLTVVLSPEEVARLFDAARAACRHLKPVDRMITFGGGVTIPLARLFLYQDLLEERFHVLMRLLHSGLVVADRRTLS
jgi:hypothetical protein